MSSTLLEHHDKSHNFDATVISKMLLDLPEDLANIEGGSSTPAEKGLPKHASLMSSEGKLSMSSQDIYFDEDCKKEVGRKPLPSNGSSSSHVLENLIFGSRRDLSVRETADCTSVCSAALSVCSAGTKDTQQSSSENTLSNETDDRASPQNPLDHSSRSLKSKSKHLIPSIEDQLGHSWHPRKSTFSAKKDISAPPQYTQSPASQSLRLHNSASAYEAIKRADLVDRSQSDSAKNNASWDTEHLSSSLHTTRSKKLSQHTRKEVLSIVSQRARGHVGVEKGDKKGSRKLQSTVLRNGSWPTLSGGLRKSHGSHSSHYRSPSSVKTSRSGNDLEIIREGLQCTLSTSRHLRRSKCQERRRSSLSPQGGSSRSSRSTRLGSRGLRRASLSPNAGSRRSVVRRRSKSRERQQKSESPRAPRGKSKSGERRHKSISPPPGSSLAERRAKSRERRKGSTERRGKSISPHSDDRRVSSTKPVRPTKPANISTFDSHLPQKKSDGDVNLPSKQFDYPMRQRHSSDQSSIDKGRRYPVEGDNLHSSSVSPVKSGRRHPVINRDSLDAPPISPVRLRSRHLTDEEFLDTPPASPMRSGKSNRQTLDTLDTAPISPIRSSSKEREQEHAPGMASGEGSKPRLAGSFKSKSKTHPSAQKFDGWKSPLEGEPSIRRKRLNGSRRLSISPKPSSPKQSIEGTKSRRRSSLGSKSDFQRTPADSIFAALQASYTRAKFQ